jgi:adenosylcobinamide kinase/adenosylcobinamide-phosphate guanylyltransferase
MTTLILGPVRSGKSTRAHALALASGKRVTYCATAAIDPDDAEMTDRVARHRAARPAEWNVRETAGAGNIGLLEIIRAATADECLLVDALGTWLAALLFARGDAAGDDALATLAALDTAGVELEAALAVTRADVILVAEETGWGVVPASALGRVFRDALGRLTQRLGARVDRAELVVAGFAVDLRTLGTRVEHEGHG